MTRYDPEAFAALTTFAQSTIPRQNERYDNVANFAVPESARNAQNRIAVEQSEHLELLDDLATELPYEQIALDCLELEREIERTQELIATVDTRVSTEKLSVAALGSRIMELMPDTEPVATRRINSRLAEINRQQRDALNIRLEQLTVDLGELSLVTEVAFQPWPLPRAHFIAPEPAESAPRNGVIHTEGDLSELVVMPAEPCHIPRVSSANPDSLRGWHVDEPNASRYIALHFVEHVGEVVTVNELIDFVYSHCKDEIKEVNSLRSRITTILGPQIQGQRMARLLASEGLALQYGWKKQMRRLPGGEEKQFGPRKRIYRAVRIEECEDKLPEFVEVNYVTDSAKPTELTYA